MNPSDRYDVSQYPEAQFEPGSHQRVLKNLLGIKHKRKIDILEAQYLGESIEKFFKTFDRQHRFRAADICELHREWLGRLYPWAGHYRNINLSKAGFYFSASATIPQLMKDLEDGALKKYTPCVFKSKDEIIRAIAVVHGELVLIHPFRDGNGRVARILAVLMGLQAGLPPLDFSDIRGLQKKAYFRAVQMALKRDYAPMEDVFRRVVDRTLMRAERASS